MSLEYRDKFELLIAVVLSAQCTDAKVNKVLPSLFERYPGASDLSEALLPDLERILRPLGLFRSKARNIREIARMTRGRVPGRMKALMVLPGVGRKTANVVMTEGFALAEGIAVDTHCGRLARRLGWSRQDNPEKVEADLVTLVPRKDWPMVTHLFIAHGRATCRARNPLCKECVIADLCPSRRD